MDVQARAGFDAATISAKCIGRRWTHYLILNATATFYRRTPQRGAAQVITR